MYEEGRKRQLTRNDNNKAITVLAGVGSSIASDLNTPSRTLDVGQRWRVGAIGGVRVHSWVTLVIDVESCAAVKLVAIRSTSYRVVTRKCLITQPRGSLTGPLLVDE